MRGLIELVRLPGFKPIPFDKIGLYLDEYRRTLPSDDEVDRYGKPAAHSGPGYDVYRERKKKQAAADGNNLTLNSGRLPCGGVDLSFGTEERSTPRKRGR